MGVIEKLNRFNKAHPWSHNDFYIPWVLRQLDETAHSTALDVGCGTGNLLDRLAQQFDSVTGLEPDPLTAQIASARLLSHATVNVRRSTLADTCFGESFDAITLIAVLHHLPLETTLSRLRSMLNPGGRLIIVGALTPKTGHGYVITQLAAGYRMCGRFRSRQG